MKFLRYAVPLTLVLFFLSQLSSLFHPTLIWDEAVYLGMGKFFFSAGASGLYESFRPPLLPFLLGLLWKLGYPLVLLRGITLLFALGNLVLLYHISKCYLQKHAWVAPVLLATTPVFFTFSTQFMTSIIASFFVLASFCAYQQKKWLLVSFFCGLAFLTRFPAGMFFGLYVAAYLFEHKAQKLGYLLKLCGVFGLTIAPYFLLNYFLGHGILQPLLDAAAHQGNQAYAQDYGFYVHALLSQGWYFLLLIPGVLFAAKRKHHALLCLGLVPLLYFSSIANKQPRFVLLCLPVLILLCTYGFEQLTQYLGRKHVLTGMLTFLLFLSILFSLPSMRPHYPSTAFAVESDTVILTADPIFTQFSDARFVPMYFDVYQAKEALALWGDQASLVIYTDAAYPCDVYADPHLCREVKAQLLEELENTRSLEERDPYILFS